VVVAVRERLGQAFRVVGVLDLVAEPLELLPSLRSDRVLHAHQEAHRRREILLRSTHVEAAVVFLRPSIPRDRAARRRERVQAPEQARQFVVHRRRFDATKRISRTSAFGDTYGHERDEAERRRWPVSTLPAEHLHLLNDPDQVATELVDLMRQLGISASTG